MQLGEGASWVERVDEKCFQVGEVLHVFQGARGSVGFIRPVDILPSPCVLSW